MKCTIPEISWHNRDPILSIDVQPTENEKFYRLASAGCDCHILIWLLKIQPNGAVNQEMVCDLSRHQRAVNVVRWSPSGQYLASGDDDANIIIWTLKTDNIPLWEGETLYKEMWIVHKILRGHKQDVYDICWSPNGMKLISGSVDNTAILWDFNKGTNEYILPDHKGFVQGVTCDPNGQYIATLSSDRVCRIFESNGKRVVARTHKGTLPLTESHILYNKEIKYFHDDTFKSYFRRLTFSPDGNLLIAPSGSIEHEDYKEVRHSTLIFTLDNLTRPVAVLPSPKQITIVVRCCPILFELHSDGMDPIIALPYRMIIAVGTNTDVILYDTQQRNPFAHFQNIHYTRITDLTWSPDGLLLIVSSTDGYCTMATFQPEELGVQYVKEESEVEESILNISGCEGLDKNDSTISRNVEQEQIEEKIKKPNLLEQWALRKTAKLHPDMEEVIHIEKNTEDKYKSDSSKPTIRRIAPIKIDEVQVEKKTNASDISKPTIRRITPIKIDEVEVVKNTNAPGELGVQYVKDEREVEESVLKISGCEDLDKNDSAISKNVEQEQIEERIKKPNLLEQWTSRRTAKLHPDREEVIHIEKNIEDIYKSDSSKPTIRRIAPIRIDEVQVEKKTNASDIIDLTNDENSEKQTTHLSTKKVKIQKINKSSPLLKFFQPIKSVDGSVYRNSNRIKFKMNAPNKDNLLRAAHGITKVLTVKLERCDFTKINVHCNEKNENNPFLHTKETTEVFVNGVKSKNTYRKHLQIPIVKDDTDVNLKDSPSKKCKVVKDQNLNSNSSLLNFFHPINSNIDSLSCNIYSSSKENAVTELLDDDVVCENKTSSESSKNNTESKDENISGIQIVVTECDNKENFKAESNLSISHKSTNIDAATEVGFTKQISIDLNNQDNLTHAVEETGKDNKMENIDDNKKANEILNKADKKVAETNTIQEQQMSVEATTSSMNLIKTKIPRRVALITLSSPKRKKKVTPE